MNNSEKTDKFLFVAGNLSVNFVNTEIVENGQQKDLLEDFNDFASWAAAADLVEKTEAETLLNNWNKREEVRDFFAEVLDFRGVLREMIVGLTNGKTVTKSAITQINRRLENQNATVELRKTKKGFEKLFRADYENPLQFLAPIAESTADLLCYGDLSLVKKCENPECVLYFYDTTKNHSRRWCSMKGCGNRAKAAAFYRRNKN